MFYIRTADKLQRTARWIESLPGGIKYLREVILEDKLGICASLEAQMAELVDSFFDEWAEAVNTPSIASKFRQFNNTTNTIQNIDYEEERNQRRPAFFPGDTATDDFKGLRDRWSSMEWQPVIETSYFDGADDLPNGIAGTIKHGDTQIAVWRIQGTYYAAQQMCPHTRSFVLSDGLIGQEANGGKKTPWVSCPLHKHNFDLEDGSCKNDDSVSIATFPSEGRADGMLYLKLPPVEELDAALGTKKWMVKEGESKAADPMAELDKRINFVGIRGKKPSVRPLRGTKMTRPIELMAGGGCGSAPDW
jgi:nitrite reductase (NAD(P)H)